jgi:tetratricopeptide (TPR) repeat protein
LLERKKEVVHDLDFNPRAIEALVAALRYETLDEIIGSNPGLWAVHDREVSRDFLKALEKDLLERTLRHLSDLHQSRLWRLAVHRRSFKREALEKLCGTKDEANELRSILVTRYLLNFYKGVLSLNPIVREISLSHLREESAEFKQAHSGAADYHLRHFKAKQIVGSQTQLGDSFAELRYHLVMAGRESELGVIGQRFTDHLKREIKSVSPVPANAEELDERVGVLTALLGSAGAKGLEYHLARCLQSRGKAGDIQQAVVHAERALGHGAPESAWYLLANLKRQPEGPDAAIAVVRRGIQELKNPDLTAPLYQLGAEILSGANKTDAAVALLKEGIKVIPPDKSLFSLYQICADLLSKVGKIEGDDGAVALLKEGIKVIPPEKNLFSLYQICAKLLSEVGKIEGDDGAVALLKEGIKVIPPEKNLFSLYQICAKLLSEVGKIEGDDGAVALLKEGIKVIPPEKNLFSLYQICADLLSKVGKLEEAMKLLNEGLAVVPANKTPWPQKGLLYLIERLETPQPVVSPVFSTPPPDANAAVDEPELYVSYAWGDETPDGIQRERVVNEMCDAVANTGRVVGRDRTVMKPGDSIDAFADKIAKAPRIVAVISAKSLHSKFCMVDEIYSAYQRCGFRRDEFRLKVIALVMGDAKPLLSEDIALVKHWKAVHDKERTALLDVDSERKELERWAKVHKLGEMCERLLGMLDAIKDTIMPRGYENIVGGNFQEVIARLPPKRT